MHVHVHEVRVCYVHVHVVRVCYVHVYSTRVYVHVHVVPEKGSVNLEGSVPSRKQNLKNQTQNPKTQSLKTLKTKQGRRGGWWWSLP